MLGSDVQPQLGIINYVLKSMGVQNPPNWSGSQTFVWVLVAVASVFTFQTGQQMLVFSAALKDVPQELYEPQRLTAQAHGSASSMSPSRALLQ